MRRPELSQYAERVQRRGQMNRNRARTQKLGFSIDYGELKTDD